jgi:hypothetical protein
VFSGTFPAVLTAGPGATAVAEEAGALVSPSACRAGLCGTQCFVAGTLVATADGLRPIEEIEEGDAVWSLDPETSELGYHDVARTFVHESDVLRLTFAGTSGSLEDVVTTGTHPFFEMHDGWTAAGDLALGADVYTAGGESAELVATTGVIGHEPVFNFEVEGSHTYFVGETGLWVHNSCASIYDAIGPNTYFHYTNEAGYNAAIKAGAIRRNARGMIFVTQDAYSPAEALTSLFVESPTYGGRGDYVIAIDGSGLRFGPGTQSNEFIVFDTIRSERFLWHGLNPWQ